MKSPAARAPSAPDLEELAAGRLLFRATGDPAERASGKLTLGVVRRELSRLVRQRAVDDPHLYHLDGRLRRFRRGGPPPGYRE